MGIVANISKDCVQFYHLTTRFTAMDQVFTDILYLQYFLSFNVIYVQIIKIMEIAV